VQAALTNVGINNNDRISGTVSFQSNRTDNPDLFGFTDTTNTGTSSANITWNHRFTQRIAGAIRYQFNRTTTRTAPYFGNRVDVSVNAGITGNDSDPRNWGPPTLVFAGGIAKL